MYGAVRKVLFRMDPERSHSIAVRAMRTLYSTGALRATFRVHDPPPRLSMRAFGFDFPSPLGVAAGFDKEVDAYNPMLALGFGHVEAGTVTPRPQPGNDPPRVQRILEENALVNRMGFPGPGADAAARRLSEHPPIGVVGANIGPNKWTGAEGIPDDLRACTERLAHHAAYLAINVSSPNTPGLRALQTPEGVARLVSAVQEALDDAGTDRPVLLKLHPDAPDEDLLAVARAAVDAGASGIIAVNTTRERTPASRDAMEGGLSGPPLLPRATQVVSALHKGLGGDIPLIGVGGVFGGGDILAMVRAGASLVQAYTGFIYRGPRMATLAHTELESALDDAGLDRLEEAIGTS